TTAAGAWAPSGWVSVGGRLGAAGAADAAAAGTSAARSSATATRARRGRRRAGRRRRGAEAGITGVLRVGGTGALIVRVDERVSPYPYRRQHRGIDDRYRCCHRSGRFGPGAGPRRGRW